ncbi:hypothetical protein [Deinococcus humi]|uniref:Uncharacterized protein n=1 Tax=Deinococcus humi TaxID=662880 RepID=A0A7W8JY38_9DEIO|nr:hypothetical protein [Deinococcus humi]MBB5365367.1 hypothetical protein [Deinococcus humi]
MDAVNGTELLRHIWVLEQKGCAVRRDGIGEFIVRLPPDFKDSLGETWPEKSELHEWQPLMEAVERLGIIADDLDK